MDVFSKQDFESENSEANRTARLMVRNAKATYDSLVAAFNESAISFWRNPRATPQEIAVALGTDARSVFELHAKLGAFISGINPNALAPGKAVIGNFSFNPDGSVIITEQNQ